MKSNFSINTIVAVVAILSFIGSVFASWYSNKNAVVLLEQRIIATEQKVDKNIKILEANNLELINFKLDLVLKKLGVDVPE